MQAGVMSYFFPLLWNLSQAPEMETSFTDSNRIKASGSRWSIGGNWSNPKMCKALSVPFMGTASLKQKGVSGRHLLQVGQVKRVCPEARWYFISSFLSTAVHVGERGCPLCSHLTYSLWSYPKGISELLTHPSYRKLAVIIMGSGVSHSLI